MKRHTSFGCLCLGFIVGIIFLSLMVYVAVNVPEQPKPAQAPVATPAPTEEAPKKKGGRCFKHKFRLIKPIFCVFCD